MGQAVAQQHALTCGLRESAWQIPRFYAVAPLRWPVYYHPRAVGLAFITTTFEVQLDILSTLSTGQIAKQLQLNTYRHPQPHSSFQK
jgi:hypothetical protein